MCLRCASNQIQASETSPKVRKNRFKIQLVHVRIYQAMTGIQQLMTSIGQLHTQSILNCVFITFESINLRYGDITISKVLIFDIDVSSISNCVDIEVPRFDIEDFLISYWIDIVYYNIRYQSLLDFKHSISNVITFDIELSYRTRYRRSFSDLGY